MSLDIRSFLFDGDTEIDMVNVALDNNFVSQIKIEDNLQQMESMVFFAVNFNHGAIGKQFSRFRQLSRDTLELVNKLDDNSFKMQTLGRIANMSRTLNILM